MERELWEGPGRAGKERAPAPPSSELWQGGELCAKLGKVHTAWPLDSLGRSLLPFERDPVWAHVVRFTSLTLRVKLEA